ncbi:MAG TPA: hypothetical protein VEZ48_06865 [Sphingomonadaceae bacterium]|nr:hypothetical protein [Sphingomonadaceae bacterium]
MAKMMECLREIQGGGSMNGKMGSTSRIEHRGKAGRGSLLVTVSERKLLAKGALAKIRCAPTPSTHKLRVRVGQRDQVLGSSAVMRACGVES